MERTKQIGLHAALAAAGGLGYMGLELLWRGHTHPSMFLVGGVCFELIGCIHTRLSHRNRLLRCGLSAVAVTAVELVSGCILNRWMGLGVWDYSGMRGNLLGQVCLVYSLLWLLLSAAVGPLYRQARRLAERVASL